MKNITKVFSKWLANESQGRRGDSINTDGEAIYSYKTPILYRENRSLILDDSKFSNGQGGFSRITRVQQNQIKVALSLRQIPFKLLVNNFRK